jgi:hypothetical protein
MNTQNVRKSMQSKEKQHSQTPYRDPVGKTIPARQRLPTTPVSSETARRPRNNLFSTPHVWCS